MCLGLRNTSKSVLCDALKNTFGDYESCFNTEELLITITRVRDVDMAKKLGWTIPLQYKRFYFSSEIKTEDHKGNKLKHVLTS